jgi:hypothetical protein
MEECNQFLDNQNLYNICIGNSNLPKWKINRYRQKFGLAPLYDEDITVANIKQETILSYNNIGYGVGTELLHIYQTSGVPACQACFKLAHQMNIWGPSRCLENIELIVADIMPRAKDWISTNMPWTHLLLPSVVEEVGIRIAIERQVKTAVDNFNRKLSERIVLKESGSKKTCNCAK